MLISFWGGRFFLVWISSRECKFSIVTRCKLVALCGEKGFILCMTLFYVYEDLSSDGYWDGLGRVFG